MNDTFDLENWDDICIVCHKATDHGGGMCHLKTKDGMISLCCPVCIDIYNQNPGHYLSLRHLGLVNTPKREDAPSSSL